MRRRVRKGGGGRGFVGCLGKEVSSWSTQREFNGFKAAVAGSWVALRGFRKAEAGGASLVFGWCGRIVQVDGGQGVFCVRR